MARVAVAERHIREIEGRRQARLALQESARTMTDILEQTTDGFEIAEADLKLRGPGELLGQEQSGLPKFRFASLVDDLDLLRQAREMVLLPPRRQ